MNHALGRIFVDGESFAPIDARVSALDHGFLYGDGVFETMRVYEGHAFRLDAHVERLVEALAAVHIRDAPAKAVLTTYVRDALARVGLREASCRVSVTRGLGTRGIDPEACGAPTVVVGVFPLRAASADVYRDGMSTAPLWPRARGDQPPPWVKSTSYQRGVLARIELARTGAREGFYLDEEGNLTEGSFSNLFLVEGDTLVTPPRDVCLRGITRAEVLAIAADASMPAREEPVSAARLLAADEVFVTSSILELAPVTRFREAPLGGGTPGPVHHRLHQMYRERVVAACAAERSGE